MNSKYYLIERWSILSVFFLAFTFSCHGLENVAWNMSTVQSSVQSPYGPDLAVDGNTNQRESNCARTRYGRVVWWRVDLGEIKEIYNIKVFYRNDSNNNDSLRMSEHAGFSLFISNTTKLKDGYRCYKNTDTFPPLLSKHACAQRGRYVTYYNERGDGVVVPLGSRRDTTIAELCEVQVFGTSVVEPANENICLHSIAFFSVVGVCVAILFISFGFNIFLFRKLKNTKILLEKAKSSKKKATVVKNYSQLNRSTDLPHEYSEMGPDNRPAPPPLPYSISNRISPQS
ncbi:uncharacterized protein LOC134237411 [Saccostrea cucullata]|uniref:uncharacterized protein LOC134237411 n=1 Tax=Saccostrea cuccullata TaxID=36930 RepID=UPI002ED10A1A